MNDAGTCKLCCCCAIYRKRGLASQAGSSPKRKLQLLPGLAWKLIRKITGTHRSNGGGYGCRRRRRSADEGRNRNKSCGINGLTDRSPLSDCSTVHRRAVLVQSCPDVFLITHLALAGEVTQDDGACLSGLTVLII